jgi:hypothetical protein
LELGIVTRQKCVQVLAAIAIATALSASPVRAQVTNGLFSRYSFDIDARDDVGSNNGTLVNGASITSDPVRGNVLALDGTDDYVGLPADNMAAGRGEISVAMWLKPDEWSGERMIYDEPGGSYGEWWQFSMSCGAWYTRDTSTGPEGGRSNDIDLPGVPVGQWHHLAFVYSVSTSTKAIYYDGAPYSSSSTSIEALTTDRATIGIAWSGDTRNLHFDGMVDEVRFYNRALSPSEVAELAATTAYTLTVNSGSGDGDYAPGVVVDISAGPAPSGLGFSHWAGDTAGVTDVHAPDTTISMPSADAAITATYAAAYTLTVNSGSGGGLFGAGAVLPVVADDAPAGYAFDHWAGDTSAVADTFDNTTTVTMPAGDVTITAVYEVHAGAYLTVNNGSGDGGYDPGTVVAVQADPAPSGMEFNMWIGDLEGFETVNDKISPSSDYTMPDTSATVTATYIPAGTPRNWYPAFDVFCKAMFGATREQLVYDTFGTTLALVDTGEWQYASKNSATVAFQTNLPAKGRIEYGPTASYGSETAESDRYFYTHIFHLTGLSDATTYHYRLVVEDEVGNVLASPDRTLTTATPSNVIYVPAGVSGPPYNLNSSGKTYLLTQDLVVGGKAFDVSASNVKLDLGGHTVVYDNDHMGTINGDFWAYINQSSIGVRAMDADGLKVLNGTIRQGAGADSAESSSIGFNPIYTNGCTGMEIAGVTIEYNGPQQVGIYNHWSGDNSRFHHNVFLDTATEMINRHGAGCRSILMYGNATYNGIEAYNNLVLRTRQSALGGNDVHDNEIYMDSWATNSFAVATSAGGEAYGNKVFGTGYHVVAFGWTTNLTYHHNFVHLEGEPPDGRFEEFGDQISLNGFRLTQYAGSTNSYQNNLYHDNVVIVTAVGSSECRGVQFFSDPYVGNLVFRDSVLKAMVRDDVAHQAACVVTQGNPDRTETMLPIYYLNDTFISNICNVRFGDYYGVGSNHRFHDCTFVHVGDDPRYKTFLWDSYYDCKYHVVRDPAFEGGASLSSISFGSGDHSMTVEWTLTVRTDPYADVTVRNQQSQVVFTGNAGASGSVSTPLPACLAKSGGYTWYTPHTVSVSLPPDGNSASVTMDATKAIDLYATPRYTLTVNSGSGSGQYGEGDAADVEADAPAGGMAFDAWTGDTGGLDDPTSAATTLTMPAADVEITATYVPSCTLTGDRTGDQFVGQADLDIILASWGQHVALGSPADPSGDGFVGQADLDIVLSQWGGSCP